MRLLLTGGHGFTGLHLADAATRAGIEVTLFEGDLTDRDATLESVAAAAPSHVVHLGAISAVTHGDLLELFRVNLFGTLNLLEALAALPNSPESVVLASSANVYGNSQQSPITEDAPPAPVNHYAMSKLAMEHMARAEYGSRLPLVVVRPFNYTGVGHDERFVIPKLVRHFALRLPRVELGNIDVEREFNDVRAVREAYLALLTAGAAGEVFNLCTGRPISLRTVIDRLVALSGHTLEVAVNPAFVRANEIHRLCGDPTRLVSRIGPLRSIELDDTLTWMLDAARRTG